MFLKRPPFFCIFLRPRPGNVAFLLKALGAVRDYGQG